MAQNSKQNSLVNARITLLQAHATASSVRSKSQSLAKDRNPINVKKLTKSLQLFDQHQISKSNTNLKSLDVKVKTESENKLNATSNLDLSVSSAKTTRLEVENKLENNPTSKSMPIIIKNDHWRLSESSSSSSSENIAIIIQVYGGNGFWF